MKERVCVCARVVCVRGVRVSACVSVCVYVLSPLNPHLNHKPNSRPGACECMGELCVLRE